MNERIKELAERAGAIEAKTITNIPRALSLNGEEIQEFAELIVKECMEQIHIQSRGPCGDYHGQWFESNILQHFGVEE
jgi:hypothetical protein